MSVPSSPIVPGTFTPSPHRASASTMLMAQAKMESKLMLRHGEQLLLNLFIPVAVLIVSSSITLPAAHINVQNVFPMTLAIAATSSGFTGQAIALAFDRRYGALKRAGASGVPPWTLIAGKVSAVLVTSLVQVAVLTATAVGFGWRTSLEGAVVGGLILLIGIGAFCSLGLLIGGWLRAELVLGLANLVWFVLVGVVGLVMYFHGLGNPGWFTLVPSVALASGLTAAFSASLPVYQILVLGLWFTLAAIAATATFRFNS